MANKEAKSSASVAVDSNTVDSRRKKPVPLPRSKIPVPQQQQQLATIASEKPKESLHSRFFGKRSKTDLGGEALQSYKAKKHHQQHKSPAPKVPTFNRPVPLKRQTEVIEVSSNREKRSLNALKSGGSSKVVKPEIKEKPQFSTFKNNHHQNNNAVNNSQTESSRRKLSMTKMASESDLLSKLREEEESEDDENSIIKQGKKVIFHKSSA